MPTHHTNPPKKSKKYLGFTLVELIVVITILVILGTIAFLNLGGFSGSARDSARISNLANLQKGLNVYQVKTGTYPTPESSVAITASGVTIGYQGFAKDIVGGIAKVSKGGTVDPSDSNIYTTYAVNQTLTKMQAMVFLEDSTNVTAYEEIPPTPLTKGGIITFFNPLIKGVTSEASRGIPGIDTTYAAITTDYSKRFPKTSGDSLGILLSTATGTLNQPVQETGTGVDVVTTNTGYLAVFSKSDSITGSGNKLVAMKVTMKNIGTLPLRDTSLIGYWDMETIVSSGKLAEMSGNGNGGTSNGGVTFGGVVGNGKTDKGTDFDGVNDVISMPPETINFANSAKGSISVWIKSSTCGYATCYIFVNDEPNTNYHLFLAVTNAQKAQFSLYNGSYSTLTGNKNTLLDGAWHMITGQWDSSGMKIFIDGKLDASNALAITHNNYAPGNSYIGADYYSSSYDGLFTGTIDELRIYNRALGDSEIQTLYNATK